MLVCGKVPFDDQSMPALHAKIKEGKVEYPSWLSSDCCDILRRMLVVDSKNRASLEEIKHHPWLTKGYDKPPESYVPHRTPLQGPLDPAVINEMSGFDFGSPEEIHTHLRTILESLEYQSAVNNWFKLNGESEKRSRHFSLDFYRRRVSISQELKSYPDPTNAYHPLISIYYLVREKQLRERERIADLEREASALALVDNNNSNYSNNNNNNNSSGHHLLPHRHHSQSSSNNTSLHSNRASIEAPVLPVPETAHTQHDGPSSIQNLGMKNDGMRIRAKTQGASDYPATSIPYSPPTRRRSRHQAHASEPPLISIETSVNYSNVNTQQQNSGIAGSILRRFSTRKKQSDVPRPTPTIITNTTYEPTEPTESSACNGQDMFSGNIRRKATVSGTTPSSFHPTARAKSLGHVRRKSTLRYYRDAAGNDTAPQPSTYNDESFDEIALIDEISHNVGNDMDGEMLSIQYPKQVFLKGFFSVQSTSTKSLAFIRSDIIRVLTHLGISYREIRGGFLCVHKPSIKIEEEAMQAFSPPQSPHMVTTPQQGHWRKLSFGSGIFGARRRSISIIHGQGSSSESYNTSDVSAESVGGNSGGNGGSDMLGFNSQESSGIRTPLKFELYIVKVPLLMSLHGVQFKKLAGNSWQYKSLATKILSELRL